MGFNTPSEQSKQNYAVLKDTEPLRLDRGQREDALYQTVRNRGTGLNSGLTRSSD